MPVTTTADIDKATLTYKADAVTIQQGQTPDLTGTVTGFVENESFATEFGEATANWTSPYYNGGVGVYAVEGSGLESTNYEFVQAQKNLTALTVEISPTTVGSSPTTTNTPNLTNAVSNTQQSGSPPKNTPSQTPPQPYQEVELDISPSSGVENGEDDTLYDVIQTYGCSV